MIEKPTERRQRKAAPATSFLTLMGRRLWTGWQRLGRRIGDVQARVILALFYFVCIGPFALIVRWGADPLRLKKGNPTGWRLKEDGKVPPMERAMNQF